MRPYGSPKTLERRRRKALGLLTLGLTLVQVARRVGVSVSSVFRWQQMVEEAGVAGLAPRPVPGRPKKLQPTQLNRLSEILVSGARAWGFPNELWTLRRIARVIEKEFHVHYHPGHVWKVLRQAGWTCQVPERRALERDEERIAGWKRYKWPAIKKKGRKAWSPSRLPG